MSVQCTLAEIDNFANLSVCNGQEFVTFSVQKPIENPIVAGVENKKTQGQKRRERRKRLKEKVKQAQSDDTVTVEVQEVTAQEVVSTEAETSDEVFEEDLEVGENNPTRRLRVRSRRLVLSIGAWSRRGS